MGNQGWFHVSLPFLWAPKLEEEDSSIVDISRVAPWSGLSEMASVHSCSFPFLYQNHPSSNDELYSYPPLYRWIKGGNEKQGPLDYDYYAENIFDHLLKI